MLGVDARLQKRLVQIYGVYSSLSNKTLCRGRSLSDFLVNTDPLAAVYLVGSAYYPSDSAGCGDGELCIDDVISRTGAGTELIYQNLFQEPIQPEIAFSTSNELSGLTLFSASDFDTHGSEKNVNSVNSKPFFDNRIARVDLYFPFSRYKMNRAVSGQLDVPTLQATNYNVVTSSCGASLGTYADVQIKIWDTANSTWMNPPVNGSTFDVIKVAANGSYTLNFIDLADESVQPLSVNGRDYLIFSLRSQNTSCSSLNVNFPSLSFY